MSHPSILVVDDSVTIQKVFELAFESEEVDLTVVGDSQSALAAARARTPRLVIADINMPDGDGFSLCRALKSEPSLAHTPVFLLGSALDDFDEDAARKAGADGKFEKPFRSEEMVARVKEVIARSGPVARPEPEEAPGGDEPADPDFDGDSFDEIDIPLESLLAAMGAHVDAEPEEAPTADGPDRDEFATTEDAGVAPVPPLLDLRPQAVDGGEEDDDQWEAVVEEPFAAPEDDEPHLRATDDLDGTDESDFTPTTPFADLDGDEEELSEEAIQMLSAIDEAAGVTPEEARAERLSETVTERVVPGVAAMSPEALSAAVELAVSRAVEGMISRDVVEKAVTRAVNSLLADMRDEMLDVFKKVAADVTLSVAEDLVRQTIEQIKSDVAPAAEE